MVREFDLAEADADAGVVTVLAGRSFPGLAAHPDRERRIQDFEVLPLPQPVRGAVSGARPGIELSITCCRDRVSS